MTTTPDAVEDVKNANILALLGDSITTDHISPAGAIKGDGPAGRYLKENKVDRKEFNSFGSRRGNHEVMMRGTFANIRIKNLMAPGTVGGVTTYVPTGEVMSIFDAAQKYKEDNKDLVVFAGGLYGNGSSRDWAAKGTILLGVKAVIAQSFERIHRSNLIGMGVLPLEFQEGDSWEGLGLTGNETVDIANIDQITPRSTLGVTITYPDGKSKSVTVNVRIDTENELDGSILAVRDRICWRPSMFIVLASLGVSGMLIASAPSALGVPNAIKWPAFALESMSVVFVWWFGLALFRDNFRLRWQHIAILCLTVSLRLPHNIANHTQAFYYPPAIGLLCVVIVISMMIHLVFVILKESEDDLVINRRKSRRYFTLGIVVSALLSTFSSQGWLPVSEDYIHFVKPACVFPLRSKQRSKILKSLERLSSLSLWMSVTTLLRRLTKPFESLKT